MTRDDGKEFNAGTQERREHSRTMAAANSTLDGRDRNALSSKGLS